MPNGRGRPPIPETEKQMIWQKAKEMALAYRGGVTYTQLAIMFRRSERTIAKIIQENLAKEPDCGLELRGYTLLRRTYASYKELTKTLSPEEKYRIWEEIKEEAMKKGKANLLEYASKYFISLDTLRALIYIMRETEPEDISNKFFIHYNYLIFRETKLPRRRSTEVYNQIKEIAREKGVVPLKEIAKILGINTSYVRSLINRYMKLNRDPDARYFFRYHGILVYLPKADPKFQRLRLMFEATNEQAMG